MRRLIADLRAKGKLLLVSSHRMLELERACDRLLMIHQGRIVAPGTVSDIHRLTEDRVRVIVDTDTDPTGLDSVESFHRGEQQVLVVLKPEADLSALLRDLVAHDRPVQRIERVRASLEDLFISMVSGAGAP